MPDPQVQRFLGRDTAATMANWATLVTQVPEAPHIFAGTAPEASPMIRRFVPGGYDNQDIGCCVGKAGRNGCGVLIKIPEGANLTTKPLPTKTQSGLFNYYNARAVSRAQGMRMGGEGAIVAHLMIALQQSGSADETLYPDSSANQKAYSDRHAPPAAAVEDGKKHLVIQAARITSKAQYFDFLGQGFPIIDGLSIGSGWMQTGEDGKFSLGGRTVGGHATLTVDYDRKTNKLYKRNSWAHWGAKLAASDFASFVDAADFAAADNYTNVGWCALDQFEDMYLGDRDFSSGQTDAFVISAIGGFEKPLILPHSNVDAFA